MRGPPCSKCSDLRVAFEISSPDQFKKALRIIRANMDAGILDDITQAGHSPSGRFVDLQEGGPWPDYVEHYFRCTECGYGFRLAVDTYHGGGGDWEPYVPTR